MAYVRMHEKDAFHFVTNRIEHELFLLLPTPTVVSIVKEWFTKAMALYGVGIELYAVIFMSNHFHLLARDTNGTLAQFMCYMQANIAKAVNKMLDRKGKFWARHYDDMIIEGENTFLNRFAYICCNSVKAGLTERADQWLGFNGLEASKSGMPITAKVFNQTQYLKASRNRKNKPDKSKFFEEFSFKMATPPMWEGLSQKKIAANIEQLVRIKEVEIAKQREFKPVLSMGVVLSQQPTDRPQDPAIRPRIRFMADTRERVKELEQLYREFDGKYREIWENYRTANLRGRRPMIEWPKWSYPPSVWCPVGYDRAA